MFLKSGTPARQEAVRFAMIYALFVAAAYPEVMLGFSSFFFRDYGYFGYPLAAHIEESFSRGELPLWNPLSNCGVPFLAQWNTMVLYPGTWLCALVGTLKGLGWFCLGHQWLAGVGMYLLAKRWSGSEFGGWIAGISYGMGGLMQNSLMWPNNIAALAWMPWVVALGEKGWKEGRGSWFGWVMAGALQMLTGAPEVILMTWVLMGLICVSDLTKGIGISLWWQFVRFVSGVMAVGGLAACQLLPFLELLGLSQRDAGFARTAWSMPGTGWANFLVPLFHCFPANQGVFFQYDQWWTSSYYAGIGALVLALLGCWRIRTVRVWLLGAVLFCGLIVAMGDDGYVYKWLRTAVPQLGFLRYPVKFVVFAAFLIPLLAAHGAAVVEAQADGWRGWAGRGRWLGIWLLVGSLMGFLAWFAWRFPMPFDDTVVMVKGAAERWILFGAFLVALLSVVHAGSARGRRLWVLGGVAALWIDFMNHAPRQNPTVSPKVYEPGLLKLSPQPRHGVARAMISPQADAKFRVTSTGQGFHQYVGNRLGLFSNCNMLDGIPKVNGFFSLFVRESERIRAHLYGAPGESETSVKSEGLLDFLGVAFVTKPGSLFDWVARPGFMPFVTGGQRPVFLTNEESYQRVTGSNWDPRREVVLPVEARDSAESATEGAAVTVSDVVVSAQRIQFSVRAEAPAWVTLSQSWYPAWTANLDGKAVAILKANYFAQAIAVPPGMHTVVVSYQDKRFLLGGCVSFGTLLLILGTLVARRRVRTGQPIEPE